MTYVCAIDFLSKITSVSHISDGNVCSINDSRVNISWIPSECAHFLIRIPSKVIYVNFLNCSAINFCHLVFLVCAPKSTPSLMQMPQRLGQCSPHLGFALPSLAPNATLVIMRNCLAFSSESSTNIIDFSCRAARILNKLHTGHNNTKKNKKNSPS